MNHVVGVLIHCLEKIEELWKQFVVMKISGGDMIFNSTSSLAMMTMIILIVPPHMMRLL